jgi:2-phosphosulfolactate phosphatase
MRRQAVGEERHQVDVLCEWGLEGVRRLGRRAQAVVVVDVLSFSTATDIAVSRGASIYPYPEVDEHLPGFAREVGAELGGRRGECRFSLSPACYLSVEPGTRIALSSVNGGVVTRAASSELVLTACLRNAAAVARAVSSVDTVAVIPAGERWADGSLRPCIEDWLGAGAVISHITANHSAESAAARAMFSAVQDQIGTLLYGSVSGRELVGQGYREDVALAAELDVSDAVPVLRDGAYTRLDG